MVWQRRYNRSLSDTLKSMVTQDGPRVAQGTTMGEAGIQLVSTFSTVNGGRGHYTSRGALG